MVYPYVRHNILEMRTILTSTLFLLALNIYSQQPIIDVHAHCWPDEVFDSSPEGIKDTYGNISSLSAEEHFNETYSIFQKYNITAIVSGRTDIVEDWVQKDTDNRIIRGLMFGGPNNETLDTAQFESLIQEGKIEVFGEVLTWYAGELLSDPRWDPYLRICEKYDIPVGIHTGGGGEGVTYRFASKARLSNADPYLLEDILIKYPNLRVYFMHSGGAFHEHVIRLMLTYPQLYSGLGAMLWAAPLDKYNGVEFLKKAKAAGYLDRVMFGSDQMFWPDAIVKSIDFLNSMEFLTEEEKRDIFYNNAAKFFKVEK